MYAQREKPKEKKKQVTVVVNQTKTSPRLGEDCLAHRPNGLGQRHDKAQIRNAAARYCQPSPSTIQRMDDDKDKDKDKDKEQTSENLDNLQLSLELLGMTPGVGMIADAANVGISLFRGNYADALINLAAMVPLVGQGVTGGKLATKAASSATDVLGATKAKTANNLVDDVDSTVHSSSKEAVRNTRKAQVETIVPIKLSPRPGSDAASHQKLLDYYHSLDTDRGLGHQLQKIDRQVGVPAYRKDELGMIQEFDAHENEILYRGFSEQHYQQFLRTGDIPATKETFVSPLETYSNDYDGILMRYTLQPGTSDQLLSIGGYGNKKTLDYFPKLPHASSGWADDMSQIKFEGKGKLHVNDGNGVINTGLGKGTALDIFNQNILRAERLK